MEYNKNFQYSQDGFHSRTHDAQQHTNMQDQNAIFQSSVLKSSTHQFAPYGQSIPGQQSEHDIKKAQFEQQQRKLKEISSRGFKTKPKEGKSLLDEFLMKADVSLAGSFKQNQISKMRIPESNAGNSQQSSVFSQTARGYWPSSNIPETIMSQGMPSAQNSFLQNPHQFQASTPDVTFTKNLNDKSVYYQQPQPPIAVNAAAATKIESDFGDFQGSVAQKPVGLGSLNTDLGFSREPKMNTGIIDYQSKFNITKPDDNSFQQSNVTAMSMEQQTNFNDSNIYEQSSKEVDNEDPYSPEKLYGSKLPKWCSETQLLPAIYKKILERSLSFDGSIDTKKLYPILLASNVSKEKLRDIWEMTNKRNPGFLVEEELYIVLGLIALAQAGWSRLTISKLGSCVTAPIPEFPEYLFMNSEKESVFGGEAISTDDFIMPRSDSPINPDDKYSVFKSFERARSASIASTELGSSNSASDLSMHLTTKMQSITDKNKDNDVKSKQDINTSESSSEWGILQSSFQNEIPMPRSSSEAREKIESQPFYSGINNFAVTSHSVFPVTSHSVFPVTSHSVLPVTTHSVLPVTTHSVLPVTTHSVFPVTTHSVFPATHAVFPVTTHAVFPVTTHSVFPVTTHSVFPVTTHSVFSSTNVLASTAHNVTSALPEAQKVTDEDFHNFASWSDMAQPTGNDIVKSSDLSTGLFSPNKQVVASPFADFKPEFSVEEISKSQLNTKNMQMDDFGDFQTIENTGIDSMSSHSYSNTDTQTKNAVSIVESNKDEKHQEIPSPKETMPQILPSKGERQPVILDDSWEDFTAHSSSSNSAINLAGLNINGSTPFSNLPTNTTLVPEKGLISSEDVKNVKDQQKSNYDFFATTAVASIPSGINQQDRVTLPPSSSDPGMFSLSNTVFPKTSSAHQIDTIPSHKKEEIFSDFAAFSSSIAEQSIDPNIHDNDKFGNVDIFSSLNNGNTRDIKDVKKATANQDISSFEISSKLTEFGNFDLSGPAISEAFPELIQKPTASQMERKLDLNMFHPTGIANARFDAVGISHKAADRQEISRPDDKNAKYFIAEPALEAEDRYKAITGVLEDSDVHVCEWKKFLMGVKKVFNTATKVIKSHNLSLQSKEEVFESQKGKDYFNDLKAIFAIVCRVKMSISNSAFAKINEELKNLLQNIDSLWREICNFSSGLSQHNLPSSLEELKATMIEDSSSNVCGLCLLNVDNDPTEINGCIISTAKLTYGGKYYHSTCANFWCNKVNPVLPALQPLAAGLL